MYALSNKQQQQQINNKNKKNNPKMSKGQAKEEQ